MRHCAASVKVIERERGRERERECVLHTTFTQREREIEREDVYYTQHLHS